MANHKSALKRHRQSLEHMARNRANKTRVKNAVKAVNSALNSEDINAAHESLVKATSVLAKAASKGAIHWRKAARKTSRLARAVNQASKQAQS
ncbi:MAG: 30S ribosomal protein S20 [Desulfovibrionaceae bacterium]|nr:30S ribosomal protein S20 [Desulfovibrionaceae bacterium]